VNALDVLELFEFEGVKITNFEYEITLQLHVLVLGS
jgi:hypothetical protein